MKPLYIHGWGSISALGQTRDEVFLAYTRGKTVSSKIEGTSRYGFSAPLPNIKFSDERFNSIVDPIHRFALYTASLALNNAGWGSANDDVSILLGSARGATKTLETAMQSFDKHDRLSSLTSPLTTAGNIAAFCARELTLGSAVSASMTCASALEALFCAAGLLSGGMISRVLVGGAEAPLTPFTINQMEALRIYSAHEDDFPCRPASKDSTENNLALGEGACVFALSNESINAVARISGISCCIEHAPTPTGMDPTGSGYKNAMLKALHSDPADSIDAIILHAPGTKRGDAAELVAIQEVFGEDLPPLFSTKYLTGHTFGASVPLSMELALLMIQGCNPTVPNVYTHYLGAKKPFRINRILVNGSGFGGVVGSLVIERT